MKKLFALLLVFSLVWISAVPLRARTLDIPPVQQNTQVWCWVAVLEMVMRHYDVPNASPVDRYQCGIVGTLAYGSPQHRCSYNCFDCTFPAGNAQNLIEWGQSYPRLVRRYLNVHSDDVALDYSGSPISARRIARLIEDGQPIIAGISPSRVPANQRSSSEHVALIVGYQQDGEILIVNDPFPFTGPRDPYIAAGAQLLRPGRYIISHRAFVQRLGWAESFVARRISVSRFDETTNLPAYCCTQVGRLGPYQNSSVSAGGQCFGSFGGSQFLGVACY